MLVCLLELLFWFVYVGWLCVCLFMRSFVCVCNDLCTCLRSHLFPWFVVRLLVCVGCPCMFVYIICCQFVYSFMCACYGIRVYGCLFACVFACLFVCLVWYVRFACVRMRVHVLERACVWVLGCSRVCLRALCIVLPCVCSRVCLYNCVYMRLFERVFRCVSLGLCVLTGALAFMCTRCIIVSF